MHPSFRLTLKLLLVLFMFSLALLSRGQTVVHESLRTVGALALAHSYYTFAPAIHWLRPDGTAVLLSNDPASTWDLPLPFYPAATPTDATARVAEYELVASTQLNGPYYLYHVDRSQQLILLPPGAWSGAFQRSGVAFYPAGAANPQKNVSQRAFASEDHPAITGLVLDEARWVLLRVVGPTLATFGVTDACANPILTLHRGDRTLTVLGKREADEGLSQLDAVAELVGAFPLPKGSADCAVLVLLQPGAFTIVAKPNRGSAAGTLLTEAYFLPFGR